jgi:hypothetical protein
VIFHNLLVEGVEHGHLCRAARGLDIPGDRLELLAGATDEEDASALLGEFPGDRAAYCSSPTVDDGVVVL